MSLVSGSAAPYIATDQILVDQIVYELKSQGIFDSFRKECIADVDTKPAYQNLRQRVEGSVSSFLKEQKWKPESNKNQLREMLRKNIYESGFLETGVERIVNQVVNPKINTVFLPKVKEVFYKYIGLQTTPVITEENAYVDITLKIVDEPVTQNLLPTDLEAISPENDNVDIEAREDSNFMAIDDDDTSPPFEPIDEDLSFKLIPTEDNSIDSHLSGMSGLASHNSEQINKDKTVAMQHLLESDSQISKNSSSDDRLSIVTDEASNAKVDILAGSDGVVGAMETSEGHEDGKNEKLMNLRADENLQESKDKVTMDESVLEDSVDIKASGETSNLQIKDELMEDSKITQSSETLDSTVKLDAVDSTSKHISSHKKDVSRDHKKDSSRHHNSSKSRDKFKEAKDYKSKSSKTKSSSSTKDSKSKSNSSSASNRHSSDKDKEYSSNKRHSSSSSKDKNSSKDKSSSSKEKDKNIATSGSKDKDSGVSSKYKESSKDHSSGKGSTSSSRDKSSSKDHSKDSKSKSIPSADKSYKSEHRSSSSRKYSTSHTARDDSSKSQISSGTSKDKRDKKENSTKDDHFSSKTQRTDRRSTDRDSNDGQTKNKGGSAYNAGATLLLKSEEQRSNNNTTEDSSSSNSNSKDGSNSDCCQTGDETTKKVPEKIQIKNAQTEICEPIVATTAKDLQNYTEIKLVEKSAKENEERNSSAIQLASPSSIKSTDLPKSNVPDFVETLDAIKSHLAEYKLNDQKDKIHSTIKLPRFASNFREVRKIMKLRKQLKKQSELRKIMAKGNNITTDIKQGNTEDCSNKASSETLNAAVLPLVENTDDNMSDSSLALLEQDLSNDASIIKTIENVNTDKEIVKTNSNGDCLYLDKISEKTIRYLKYTSSFIETLSKEISTPQIKAINKKRKAQKRKISTISSDSSINDNNPDQSFPNLNKVASSCNSIPESKGGVEPLSSSGDTARVTSATAHVHVVKQRKLNNNKATQRYTSDDLYKPRPFLKGTTKRTSGRVAN